MWSRDDLKSIICFLSRARVRESQSRREKARASKISEGVRENYPSLHVGSPEWKAMPSRALVENHDETHGE